MGKRLTVRVIGSVMLVPVIILSLSTWTFGADQSKPKTNKPLLSPPKQSSEVTQARAKPAMPGPSSFTPDMTFERAIDILRHSAKPPLNIAVLWKDLEENANIYRDTPIGIDGVSGVSLRMHLKLLLMGVSAGGLAKLGYTVDDGVIVIATKESLPARMKTRVYDVTDLVAPPANYFLLPTMGMPFGGLGGYGAGGGYGMGYPGAGAGMYPGGYGNGLTGLLQNQYGLGGRSYGNYNRRPTR